MTGSIVMMVIGAVLLLPMAFLLVIYLYAVLHELVYDLFSKCQDLCDILFVLALISLTIIGAGLLWAGIATLPE